MSLLLLLGIAVAIFVGFNIGGSSTGVAFGPSVGARLLSKHWAAVLMTVFALFGGWTIGRNVIDTMGGKIVPAGSMSLTASIVILFFIGLALLISNIAGVPASTSMTAVGAIAGLGVAKGTIQWATMGRIVSWWFVAPIVAFWIGAMMGRYVYQRLDDIFVLQQSDGPLVTVRDGPVPFPALGPGTSYREFVSSVAVVLIACLMAFSAGASNVANAVAPLVGSGAIDMGPSILLAIFAISLGAFTIARRTLDTVGSGITDMPLLAALLVSVVSSSIITFLSQIGIPASLAISSTMCIAGLGWGRATRRVGMKELRKDIGEGNLPLSDEKPSGESEVKKKAMEGLDELKKESKLFDPPKIARVITIWIMTPTLSATASFAVFSLVM